MKSVPGFSSCDRLRSALLARFAGDIVVDDLSPDQDAFGWRLLTRPRLLFSISTWGGELPADRFDLQVSIIDDSLENGEIVFGPESPMDLVHVSDIVRQCQAGIIA